MMRREEVPLDYSQVEDGKESPAAAVDDQVTCAGEKKKGGVVDGIRVGGIDGSKGHCTIYLCIVLRGPRHKRRFERTALSFDRTIRQIHTKVRVGGSRLRS